MYTKLLGGVRKTFENLMSAVSGCPESNDKRATAIGLEALADAQLGYITDREWAVFAKAFFDKFSFPPTETVLDLKYREFASKK